MIYFIAGDPIECLLFLIRCNKDAPRLLLIDFVEPRRRGFRAPTCWQQVAGSVAAASFGCWISSAKAGLWITLQQISSLPWSRKPSQEHRHSPCYSAQIVDAFAKLINNIRNVAKYNSTKTGPATLAVLAWQRSVN